MHRQNTLPKPHALPQGLGRLKAIPTVDYYAPDQVYDLIARHAAAVRVIATDLNIKGRKWRDHHKQFHDGVRGTRQKYLHLSHELLDKNGKVLCVLHGLPTGYAFDIDRGWHRRPFDSGAINHSIEIWAVTKACSDQWFHQFQHYQELPQATYALPDDFDARAAIADTVMNHMITINKARLPYVVPIGPITTELWHMGLDFIANGLKIMGRYVPSVAREGQKALRQIEAAQICLSGRTRQVLAYGLCAAGRRVIDPDWAVGGNSNNINHLLAQAMGIAEPLTCDLEIINHTYGALAPRQHIEIPATLAARQRKPKPEKPKTDLVRGPLRALRQIAETVTGRSPAA